MRRIVLNFAGLALALAAIAAAAQQVINPGNGAGALGAPISIGTVDAQAPQLDCEAFTGATPDVQCQNAILAFSGVGITIDARGFSNPTFAGNPFPYKGANGHYNGTAVSGRLLLPAGTVTANVPIVIPTKWKVQGVCGVGAAGQACTVVQASLASFPPGCSPTGIASINACTGQISTAIGTAGVDKAVVGSGTGFSAIRIGAVLAMPAQAAGTLPTNSSWGQIEAVADGTHLTLANAQVNGTGNPGSPDNFAFLVPIFSFANGIDNTGGGTAFGVGLQDLNVDVNGLKGVLCWLNYWSEEMTDLNRVGCHNYLSQGADIEGSQAQNMGPVDNTYWGPVSATPVAGTVDAIIRANVPMRGWHGLSATGTTGATPSVRFAINVPNFHAEDWHVENAVVGVDLGDAITCPIQCVVPGNSVAGGSTLVNINGGGTTSSTTVLKIANSVVQQSINVLDLSETGSAWTNLLTDPNNGCTATVMGNGGILGAYLLNISGSIGLNTGNCDTLASATGGQELFQGSNANGVTNGFGSGVSLRPGQSSGNAAPGWAAVYDTIPSTTSGTALDTLKPAAWTKVITGLTTGTAQTIASIPLATENVASIEGWVTVYAINPTNHQNCVDTVFLEAGAENSNGTFVATAPTLSPATPITNCTSGVTMTIAFTWTGANPILLQVTPTTGSFTTVPTITVDAFLWNGGNSVATLP